jgi:hypothetical protein
MKIYIIDDKRDEMEKGYSAVEGNGHFASRDRLSSIIWFNEKLEGAGSMAQKQLLRCVEYAKESGGGIITDMMFHLTSPLSQDDPAPPSGLLVVMHCLAAGVPVVVCTDASEVGGHHAQALHWIFDGYVMPARSKGVLPFGWVENKDWDAAVKLLEQIHAQQKEKGGDK